MGSVSKQNGEQIELSVLCLIRLFQEAITDILLNAPHLRFSEPQVKAILQWAQELGVKEVPTLFRMKQISRTMLARMGSPVEQKVTSTGHIFSLNKIADGIAKVCATSQSDLAANR